MAATLSLDTLTSAGSGITVAAGKTLTVEGVSVTAGSSNIQRATADKTIGTDTGYEVAGKSEVVVAANAAASNRTITLPAVGATGMSTCIITVVADADATSTYALKVQDAGTTEVWTGYQKGDFVRLIVSNSAWLVVDHKETMMASKALTGSYTIASSAQVKMTGFTDITDIGKVWDNTNNKLVAPFAGIWHLNWRLTSQMSGGFVPALFVGGARQTIDQWSADSLGPNYGSHNVSLTVKVAASTDVEFYAKSNSSSSTQVVQGNGSDYSGFDGTFTRTY